MLRVRAARSISHTQHLLLLIPACEHLFPDNGLSSTTFFLRGVRPCEARYQPVVSGKEDFLWATLGCSVPALRSGSRFVRIKEIKHGCAGDLQVAAQGNVRKDAARFSSPDWKSAHAPAHADTAAIEQRVEEPVARRLLKNGRTRLAESRGMRRTDKCASVIRDGGKQQTVDFRPPVKAPSGDVARPRETSR